MAEALQECSSVMAEIASALRTHETPVLPAAACQHAPLPFPRRAAQRSLPIVWQLRLSRPMLAYALPQRTSAAAMRGTDDRYVLFDTIADGPQRRRFMIAAEEQEDSSWKVFVTIAPPLDGLLLLTIGALRLVAPFNSEGRATANHIPSDVLLPPDSSEIEIEIASVGEL